MATNNITRREHLRLATTGRFVWERQDDEDPMHYEYFRYWLEGNINGKLAHKDVAQEYGMKASTIGQIAYYNKWTVRRNECVNWRVEQGMQQELNYKETVAQEIGNMAAMLLGEFMEDVMTWRSSFDAAAQSAKIKILNEEDGIAEAEVVIRGDFGTWRDIQKTLEGFAKELRTAHQLPSSYSSAHIKQEHDVGDNLVDFIKRRSQHLIDD